MFNVNLLFGGNFREGLRAMIDEYK